MTCRPPSEPDTETVVETVAWIYDSIDRLIRFPACLLGQVCFAHLTKPSWCFTSLGLGEEGRADHFAGRSPQEKHVQSLKVCSYLQPVAVLLSDVGLLIFSGFERRVQDGRRVDRLQAAEAAVSGGVNGNS